MKLSHVLLALLLIFTVSAESSDDTKKAQLDHLKKLKQRLDEMQKHQTMHTSKIIKVFHSKSNGAQFVAYQVNINDDSIIVIDWVSLVPKKAGEEITFMSQVVKTDTFGAKGYRKYVVQYTVLSDVALSNISK